MVPLDGLVAAVYLSIALLAVALVTYIAVGVLVLKKRQRIVSLFYFPATPLIFITGFTLTHSFHNPDFLFYAIVLIILLNSFSLIASKNFKKAI